MRLKAAIEIAAWAVLVVAYWWAASVSPSGDMPSWAVSAMGVLLTMIATRKVTEHWTEFWGPRR